MATCTIATARCAIGGVMRGVTQAMAFSFQSVMTSAAAGGTCATRTTSGMAQFKAIDMAILPGLKIAQPRAARRCWLERNLYWSRKMPSADSHLEALRRAMSAPDCRELTQAQPLLEAIAKGTRPLELDS